MSIKLLLATIIKVGAAATIRNYPIPPNTITPFASIPADHLYNFPDSASGCSIAMDTSVVLACEDGYHAVETLVGFLNGTSFALSENNVITHQSKASSLRSRGDYSSYLNPDNGTLVSIAD